MWAEKIDLTKNLVFWTKYWSYLLNCELFATVFDFILQEIEMLKKTILSNGLEASAFGELILIRKRASSC